MAGFREVVARVEQLLSEQERVVVAVSGFGGSGKSTLAGKLQDYFGIQDEQVLRVDHFYGPNQDGPDIFDQSDWELIAKVLSDVKEGKCLKYKGRGYRGEAIEVDEELPRVVIIEGIRLLQPQLMDYFDISIWIDCEQEFAIERAKARDRGQGEDEKTVNLWDTDWGPKDKEYFRRYRPDEVATLLYKEYQ